jgi:hypothetical protein
MPSVIDQPNLCEPLSATRPFTDLLHKSDRYWTWGTDTLSVVDGPFCIPCCDKDQKLMRLTGAPGRRVCQVRNWKPYLEGASCLFAVLGR